MIVVPLCLCLATVKTIINGFAISKYFSFFLQITSKLLQIYKISTLVYTCFLLLYIYFFNENTLQGNKHVTEILVQYLPTIFMSVCQTITYTLLTTQYILSVFIKVQPHRIPLLVTTSDNRNMTNQQQ